MLYILISIIIFLLSMLIRNFKLKKYRLNLIDKIDIAAQKDISNNQKWLWRYKMFKSVSYDEMVFKFWRSFDSFYKDKSFLKETP